MISKPLVTFFGSGKYNMPSEADSPWKAEFDRCYPERASKIKFFSLCPHSYSGSPSRAKVVDSFLAYTKQFSGVWYATYPGKVADLWLKAI